MTRLLLFPFLLLPMILLGADSTLGPLPAEKAAKVMVLPEGFHATVFASEPNVVQPVSFCIDDRGRLFVAEALNYGTWQPTGKDRVVILEDTDGDGKADTRKVFYEGLNYITGIEVGFGGVWVISPPKLYFIPDRDGDDKPDSEPQVLFDGFGYKESRHNLVNGFTWGPDGWLYGGHGRTSPSDVGRPGTPANQRIHCDGGVYRIHPTKLLFENFADGTTNPWGVDFDDSGQCFVSNCVNPHLFHMIQGGHYEPWRNRPSSLYAYERLPTIADHWHFPTGKPKEMRGETPEVLAMGGGHAHCGTLVYLGDQFPESYRNTVFLCNVHGRRINNDILKRKGSGYTASHGKDFMISGDPWFMGVTLRTGPDGSVFVSDWSDTGECHTYKPHTENGRIYKISYGETKKTKVDLAQLTDAELVQLQVHRNDWYVRHARRILQERSAKEDWQGGSVHTGLRKILNSTQFDSPQRLRALWALYVTKGIDVPKLVTLLEDRNEHLRAWAIQLLCENKSPSEEVVKKFSEMARSDPSPVVRLYLASALQRLPITSCWSIAQGLLSHPEDVNDANLPLMDWYGIEPLIPKDPNRSIQLAIKAKIPLVRQFIARRFTEDAISKKKVDLQSIISVLADVPDEVQLDLLSGIKEGLRGQKRLEMPTNWDRVYAKLSKSTHPTIREHVVLLALTFGDAQALLDLRQVVQTPSEATKERLNALDALIAYRAEDLAPILHQLLEDKSVRRTALRGLASYADERTPQKILSHYSKWTPEEKQDAIATLASRKSYARELLNAVEKKVIARTEVSAYIARQIATLGDQQLNNQLKQVWGDIRESSPQKREQLSRYKALLTPNYLRNGDLKNGRVVFQKTCQSCHILYGEGSKIGPDLTGSNRNDLDYLLSNIIDPSSEVAQDYRMSIVTTVNGQLITGMIVEQTPNRLVIQTATEKIVLSKDDVEKIKDSPLSIMPEGQLETLKKEEIRDLIGYLMSRAKG